MTISMAWVRKTKKVQELIFVTDSRLRFGGEWDCCPKILELPRADCALCFAGDTAYAYPIMLQIQSYINEYLPAKTRFLSLNDLKTHLIKMLNNMTSLVSDLPRGCDNTPGVQFIFGGYCWETSEFRIWLFYYDRSINQFTVRPASYWRGGNEEKKITLIGDYQDEIKKRLVEYLKTKGKITGGAFNMEPFIVLRDMLREGSFITIGGAPQILKIKRYVNTERIGVYWPNKDQGKICIMGRPLLDYENTDCRIMDPDTLFIDFSDKKKSLFL